MTRTPRAVALLASLLLAAAWLTASAAESPSERDQRMAWWREARFGMFVHWGLYSGLAGTWDGKPVGDTRRHGVDPAAREGRHRHLREAARSRCSSRSRASRASGRGSPRRPAAVRRLHHQAPRRLRAARLEGQRLRRRARCCTATWSRRSSTPARRGPAGRLLPLGDRLAPRPVRVRAVEAAAASAQGPAVSERRARPRQVPRVPARAGRTNWSRTTARSTSSGGTTARRTSRATRRGAPST